MPKSVPDNTTAQIKKLLPRHGKILAYPPLWAFGSDPECPNPSGKLHRPLPKLEDLCLCMQTSSIARPFGHSGATPNAKIHRVS